MNIAMLLAATASALESTVAVGPASDGLTYGRLLRGSQRVAAMFARHGGTGVGFADINSPAVPLALYGAALAGKAFVPMNYRLSDDRLRAGLDQFAPALVIAGDADRARAWMPAGTSVVSRAEILALATDPDAAALGTPLGADDDIAVLLLTSGTTGTPKAAVLRHRNLSAYVLSTVEFLSAGDGDCALVSVPPYHIAGISAMLTSVYAGRRFVLLDSFDARTWIDLARRERVTHAMVVPTMLGRILDELHGPGELSDLRMLSYGGGPMPPEVIERALRQLPGTGFVNAYGLTETSSTIALLDPEDHRIAFASSAPEIRARLGSVGRPLPSVEISVRDPAGTPLPAGETGEVWVRGEQIAGEYLTGPAGHEGWFRTRDGGHLDAAGYLYIHGRLDDVIVRGGENIAPGEIERVLKSHQAVAEAAVVGLPDREWGERVEAAVVLTSGETVTEAELRDYVRGRLRSVMTPARVRFRASLPFNETGKLLRRVVRDELLNDHNDGRDTNDQ